MSLTTTPARQGQEPRRRSAATRRFLAICALLLFLLFVALGSWQVKRLSWKLDLIDRVTKRVHAAPGPAPGTDRWATVNVADDEYKHVSLSGKFLYDSTTKVQAATELGGGYWLLTPLCLADGSSVLVNRGFVEGKDGDLAALSTKKPAPAVCGAVTAADSTVITGLLRITEPKGAFLRSNDGAANRWYSRDVAAIAAARGLSKTAPYFVDADAGQPAAEGPADADERPTGGMTVVSFHNSHLVYALTWYSLALMVAGALVWVAREDRKLPRPDTESGAL